MLYIFAMLFSWMPYQIQQLAIAITVMFFAWLVIHTIKILLSFLPFFFK